jgi:hypothetical protein
VTSVAENSTRKNSNESGLMYKESLDPRLGNIGVDSVYGRTGIKDSKDD